MDIAAGKNDLHMQAASPQGVKKQSWAHHELKVTEKVV